MGIVTLKGFSSSSWFSFIYIDRSFFAISFGLVSYFYGYGGGGGGSYEIFSSSSLRAAGIVVVEGLLTIDGAGPTSRERRDDANLETWGLIVGLVEIGFIIERILVSSI